jgi:twitching motility protein PilI
MSRSDSRIRLREFQAQLAERLAQAKNSPVRASKLGFLINEDRYLIEISEAGEIAPLSDVTVVPHTHDWYRGLVSIRGNLVSVIDLSRFMGNVPTRVDRDSRVLSLSDGLDFNAAIIVTRMLGLHSGDAWEPAAERESPAPWQGQQWRDPQGQVWSEIGFGALTRDERFLRIGVL